MSDNISSGIIRFRIQKTARFMKQVREHIIEPMFEKWVQECINRGVIPESAYTKKEQ